MLHQDKKAVRNINKFKETIAKQFQVLYEIII